MLSRPPASLAASMSARPAAASDGAAARISATCASGTIEVRPSRADQVDVAVAPRPREAVGLDALLGAQRARDDRALRVLVGLLGRELALAHELLDERVVVGQALEGPVAQAVEAAVADVGDGEVVLADVGDGQRRAHAGARVVGLGGLP